MRHWTARVALTVAAVALPSLVDAMAIMPQPLATRIMSADAVAIGKVVGLEPQDVTIANVTYRIAVVQVNEALHAVKDAKTVRVGFIPPPAAVPAQPGVIRPFIRRPFGVQLQVGQTGLFLLTKQPKQTFYTLGNGGFVSSENNPGFEKDLKVVKTVAKVMEDPQANLKAKDADTRFLAAAALIEKYRGFRPGQTKQEPIDAAESKQILLALADADWKARPGFGGVTPNPAQLFFRLGIDKAAGWAPAPGVNQQTAIPAWLRDHADTYRIQRLVPLDSK